MIAEAISGYWGNPHNLDACDRARTEILNAINDRPFYLFGSHFLDDGGEHVLGAVKGIDVGFRVSLFTFWGEEELFKTAIHEGAHLAGYEDYGEGGSHGSYALQDLCRQLH